MPGIRRRTAFSNRSSTQRRKLVWATSNSGQVATAAGIVWVSDLLTAFHVGGASTLGATVMRTHMTLQLNPYVALGDSFTIGIIVGRLSDVAARLPSPAADPEVDWMLLRQGKATYSGAAIDATREIEIDLRAKRKLQELDQTLLLCVLNGTAQGSFLAHYTRVLLALP
jgi:hypothetical protein